MCSFHRKWRQVQDSDEKDYCAYEGIHGLVSGWGEEQVAMVVHVCSIRSSFGSEVKKNLMVHMCYHDAVYRHF